MSTNNPITSRSIVSRTKEILFSDIGEEVVMMDIERGIYFGMDYIASHIWNLIEEPIQVEDLCSALEIIFGVLADECLQDVCAFLDQANKQGLLVVHHDG